MAARPRPHGCPLLTLAVVGRKFLRFAAWIYSCCAEGGHRDKQRRGPGGAGRGAAEPRSRISFSGQGGGDRSGRAPPSPSSWLAAGPRGPTGAGAAPEVGGDTRRGVAEVGVPKKNRVGVGWGRWRTCPGGQALEGGPDGES